MIATNMRDLIEQDLSALFGNKNLEMVFTLDKLQKLELSSLGNIESLKKLTNLKYSYVFHSFVSRQLYEIVEAVPTLTHLKVSYDMEWLDSAALKKLIAKLQPNPYCENELLRIENLIRDEASH